MQRYFIDADQLDLNETYTMDKEASHHMLTVMRMQEGEKAYLVTKSEQVFVGEIISTDEKRATLRLAEQISDVKELPIFTTLYVGLPKGDKLEWIVQKATELGARRIVPVAMRYSVTKWDQKKAGKKIARLEKIAQEAAEQSHRTFVPEIGDLQTVAQVNQELAEFDKVCLAYEEIAKQGEKANLVATVQALKPGMSLAFITGPEGGFHPDEIATLADDKENVALCGLGPRILRAETAPMYLLGALSYAIELQ